ncbi:MAG TPA: cohesin domain-containing protein, partial [Bacteroidales bacterium]|nr:cohesin domain-containing protein [Bacteroidales bacterium]
MKTRILKILPLLMMLAWSGLVRAQIGTTAGSVTTCPGTIVVPVNVTNCTGVGAISLVLDFDSSKLDYLGYQNLNGALGGGLLVISSSANRVIFSWANGAGASPGTATLVEFRFSAVPSTTSLTWDTQTPGNCEYSDVNGVVLAASFTNGTATIQQPPVITTPPVNKTVLVGYNTSFSFAATGTSVAYLWQVSTNGGGTWADLTNTGVYNGVTQTTLSITGALLSMDGYKYRCRLTGTCPPVTYTDPVTLTVINPVTTLLPTAGFCPGSLTVPVTVTNFTGVAAFSMTFSYNTSCLTYTGYQSLNSGLSVGNFVINAIGGKVYMTWSSSGAVTLGNATIVELLFTGVTGSSPLTWYTVDDGFCEYSDINGSFLTSVWTSGNETIYGIPTVTSDPVNRIIAKGQNTTFGITATGQGLSYLWQYSTNNGTTFTDLSNGGYYTGVTSPTLTITGAQLALSGYQYRCRVTGTCTPVVYSNPGILTVLPNIITNCGSATVCPGQLMVPVTVTDFIGVGSFSLVLNYNPTLFSYTGYQSLNGNISPGNFIANASAGKVYLTWSDVTAATIPAGGTLVELKFTGIPGTASFTWDTGIPGNCEYVDVAGLVIFSTWNNGSATVNTPPLVTTDPVNKTIYGTGSTTFSVAASGTGLGYRWQVSTNGGSIWTNL